ncbi:hypothetical protein [Mycobacterium sp. SMC-19]|uniref:hypothetical protein n=1 Tax=Mycobacterium sp. SMC-19 TaxID=3381630 RepID=UPI00387677A5
MGGIAGILYVVIALVAGALPGAAPTADGKAITYQNYFISKQSLLVMQGWLFPLAVPLLLMFSVAVSRTLRRSNGYLGELFLTAQMIIGALLIVTMGLQIAIAQAAAELDSQLLYTIGAHFPAITILAWGFVTGIAAFAYAFSVLNTADLPRWTAYVATLTVLVCVGSTVGVFITDGPLSPEGGFTAFAPAVSTLAWYLVVSIALIRASERKLHQTALPNNVTG